MGQEGLNKLLQRYLVIGLVAGAAVGTVIEVLIGGDGIWIGLGLLLGVVIASILVARRATRR